MKIVSSRYGNDSDSDEDRVYPNSLRRPSITSNMSNNSRRTDRYTSKH